MVSSFNILSLTCISITNAGLTESPPFLGLELLHFLPEFVNERLLLLLQGVLKLHLTSGVGDRQSGVRRQTGRS